MKVLKIKRIDMMIYLKSKVFEEIRMEVIQSVALLRKINNELK